MSVRINKRLADLGLCSRREADALIAARQVLVNGKPASLGQQVTENDRVEIIGKTKSLVYLAYYKGRGIIAHSPSEHETDIATKIKQDYGLSDIYPVGRLDKDSEGLLLLTNDGRVTAPLLSPTSGIEKTYEVTVDKKINSPFLKKLASGVSIEGYTTKPAKANQKSNQVIELTLTEGKKHQIRRMCAALGYQVQSLKRVRIANIELGPLKPNQYRKLTKVEQATLLKTLQVK